MKIAVCDDEEFYVNNILERINQFGIEDIVPNKFDGYTDAQELLDNYALIRYDLIFLDIELKDYNGMDIAKEIKRINSECLIVFVSAYKDYIPESYWIGASQFFIKPIDDKIFNQQLVKLVNHYKKLNRSITFNTTLGSKLIKTRNIIYLETCYSTYKLYTTNGTYYGNSKAVMSTKKKLLEYNFFQLNRSIIINFKYVDTFKSDSLRMINDDELTITKRKRKEFKEKYFDYIDKEM
ncbi:LytR/AlgR family response regulator transcription factor [Candidatus Stoquefichus massiliensis]|uniref:LytR/AlgR family response regulator transcription factor n=1 Tax=Candidatus Stoquefichus massiliensis TaxID=1470350 RepID=UPI00048816D4|nr:LytTR family DNA-binding domain-containing protein [Candidatus Stoquefichus massiliensis]